MSKPKELKVSELRINGIDVLKDEEIVKFTTGVGESNSCPLMYGFSCNEAGSKELIMGKECTITEVCNKHGGVRVIKGTITSVREVFKDCYRAEMEVISQAKRIVAKNNTDIFFGGEPAYMFRKIYVEIYPGNINSIWKE